MPWYLRFFIFGYGAHYIIQFIDCLPL